MKLNAACPPPFVPSKPPRGASVFIAASAALVALALHTAPAHAITHEPYAAVGGGYFGGISRVLVGLGPALGYRLHVTEAISFHIESRWLLYGGNGFTTSVGGLYAFRYRAWAPAIGLQGTLSYGQQLRVIDASMPDVPPGLALSIQARVAPIRFRTGNFTIAALVFDGGAGLEAGRPSIAISFSILELGVRF
jgi:hypothetical protein